MEFNLKTFTRLSENTPKCKFCGSEGMVVGQYQFFSCGWALDANGNELTKCKNKDANRS